jgi:hypothetical protein
MSLCSIVMRFVFNFLRGKICIKIKFAEVYFQPINNISTKTFIF